MCVLLFPVNWLLFGRILSHHRHEAPAYPSSRLPFGRRRLARFLAFDYIATVFMQTSLAVLPLMVVVILGSPANAHFYIPFTIAIAIDATFISIATSLVAEGARAPHRIPGLVRLLVRRLALLAVPGVALLVIAAPLVMLPFGHEYVRQSTPVLRILLGASLFRAVMALVAAIWRLEGRSGLIAALEGCLLLTALAAAIPLASAIGITGVALAWLGATMVTGCAVAPVLIRWFRAGGEAAPAEPAWVVRGP
jgi:O-antigen/teichoic acid export membrane protein